MTIISPIQITTQHNLPTTKVHAQLTQIEVTKTI